MIGIFSLSLPLGTNGCSQANVLQTIDMRFNELIIQQRVTFKLMAKFDA